MPRAKSTLPLHICQHCEQPFTPKSNTTGRFCSHPCYVADKVVQFIVRFWEKVDRSAGPLACWPWLAYRNHFGYGMVGAICSDGKRRSVRAHRVAYELAYGPVPKGQLVLHSCDNPCCVNPAHLRAGTAADNMRDRTERDRCPRGTAHPSHLHPERLARGEDSGQARLTAAQVLAIRAAVASGEPQKAIAKALDVSRASISLIVNRKTWKHI